MPIDKKKEFDRTILVSVLLAISVMLVYYYLSNKDNFTSSGVLEQSENPKEMKEKSYSFDYEETEEDSQIRNSSEEKKVRVKDELAENSQDFDNDHNYRLEVKELPREMVDSANKKIDLPEDMRKQLYSPPGEVPESFKRQKDVKLELPKEMKDQVVAKVDLPDEMLESLQAKPIFIPKKKVRN